MTASPFTSPPPPRTAIVSAMAQELQALIHALDADRVEQHGGRTFHLGRLHGAPVVLVLCGIGKVAAATTAAVLIERFAVQRLLFTGVAGGIGPGVAVGDVVLADALLQHDMDASPLFPRWEVPLTGRSRFAADASLTAAVAAAAQRVLDEPGHFGPEAHALGVHTPRLHRGLVISGDRFVATAPESRALAAALPDALAVEMEGAALAQVCHDFGRPFAVLRVVSDRADDAAHVDFLRFIDAVAARASADIVRAWLAGPAVSTGANVPR